MYIRVVCLTYRQDINLYIIVTIYIRRDPLVYIMFIPHNIVESTLSVTTIISLFNFNT